jgi:hypothetical protein
MIKKADVSISPILDFWLVHYCGGSGKIELTIT